MDDISYSDSSLVFNISGWRKSAATEKVSVTIKAGSLVVIDEISYLYEEDVTFVNLILYDETSNVAKCWELLGTVHTIDCVGSYVSANDTLVFWIRNADGANMSNLDVPNEKVNHGGLYHRTYASNRSLDYKGSVKINGIELSQMRGTCKEPELLCVWTELRFDGSGYDQDFELRQ